MKFTPPAQHVQLNVYPVKSFLHLFHRGGANYKQTNNQQKDGVIHETEKGAGKGPKNTLGSG